MRIRLPNITSQRVGFSQRFQNLNYVYGSNAQVVGSVWDAVDIREHPQVCRSLSKQVGALNYARLGDGHATGMPTQRAGGRGLEFDGSQYVNLDWAAGGALDSTSFTFLCYAKCTPDQVATSGRLYEIGISNQRYVLFWDTASETLKFLRDLPTDVQLISTESYPDGNGHVYAVTLDSTGCKMYLDGRVVESVVGDIRLPSFDSATKAMIGTWPGAAGNVNYSFKGTMYSSAIYPFALTQSQVREVGRRMRQARNI